ncbi:hypothetical protein [Streptomyces sp. NPDC056527]|uniref:hypothetical protein n=1 Tax=Streptomyces sp. NPDC056527 TaxID=3345853 RepID=UPI0036BF171D
MSVHRGTQFFQLYVINNEDAFFGHCPIRPNKVVAQSETIEIYDLVGKDTTLFHHSINDGQSSSGAAGSHVVRQRLGDRRKGLRP